MFDGDKEGSIEGLVLGAKLGVIDGRPLGDDDGSLLGSALGIAEGVRDGIALGAPLGLSLGHINRSNIIPPGFIPLFKSLTMLSFAFILSAAVIITSTSLRLRVISKLILAQLNPSTCITSQSAKENIYHVRRGFQNE